MEELQLHYVAEYASNDPTAVTNVLNNEPDIQTEVNTLLDVMQARWASAVYGFRLYRSIKAVWTDGSLRQVVWNVDCNRGATTAISLNSETMAGPARHLERSRRRWIELTGAQYPSEQRRFRNGDGTGIFRQEGF